MILLFAFRTDADRIAWMILAHKLLSRLDFLRPAWSGADVMMGMTFISGVLMELAHIEGYASMGPFFFSWLFVWSLRSLPPARGAQPERSYARSPGIGQPAPILEAVTR